jgi:hypothetical protein
LAKAEHGRTLVLGKLVFCPHVLIGMLSWLIMVKTLMRNDNEFVIFKVFFCVKYLTNVKSPPSPSVSTPATTIDSLAAEDSLHLDEIVDPCQLEDRSWWPSAPLSR